MSMIATRRASRLLAVVALAGAGGIHLVAAGQHAAEGLAHVLFFAGAGSTQLLGAPLVAKQRNVTSWLVALNATLLAVWLISRTAGLPGEAPEPVGLGDALASGLEVVAIGSLLAGVRSGFGKTARAGVATAVLSALLFASIAVAVPVAHQHSESFAADGREHHDHGDGGHTDGGHTGGEHGSLAARLPEGAYAHGVTAPGDDDAGLRRPKGARIEGRSISVGRGPAALVEAAGSVWSANREDGSLTRIDPTGGAPRTYRIGGSPSALAAAPGVLWIADYRRDLLLEFNLTTTRVTARIPVGPGPSAVALNERGIWVASSVDGTVELVDPARRAIVKRVAVGFGPTALVADDTDVWVAVTLDRTLARVDSGRARLVGRPLPLGAGPVALSFSGDRVFVASASAGTVTAVDRRSGRIVGEPLVVDDRSAPGRGPSSIATAGERSYVANNHDATVRSIDAAHNVGEARFFAARPFTHPERVAVLVAAGSLWVTQPQAGAVVRMPLEREEQ